MSSRNWGLIGTSSVWKEENHIKPLLSGWVEYYQVQKENSGLKKNEGLKAEWWKQNKTQITISNEKDLEEWKIISTKDDLIKEIELICITADSKIWSNKLESLSKISDFIVKL